MTDKKDPGKFTIRFNICDPQHKAVIDLLNRQGRSKAQFLVSAVLHYAKPANEGLFCVKDYCNHGHIGSYTLITPQGKLYFAQLRDMILMVV